MARLTPYALQLQITRMFEQGQSFFAVSKVHDWLKAKNENPTDYDVSFHERPAPPGSGLTILMEVDLKRRDGQPVDDWLQQELDAELGDP